MKLLAPYGQTAAPFAAAAAGSLNGAGGGLERRSLLTALALTASLAIPQSLAPLSTSAADYAYQPALEGKDYGKSKMAYSDFVQTPSGLSYKDATIGKGKMPEDGDRVVIEWSGFTIGYFGRPFETKRLQQLDGEEREVPATYQGNSLNALPFPYPIAQGTDSRVMFYRFELGAKTVIPALEEGVRGMAEGGIRQLVVPPEIGYPPDEPTHLKVGPKPSTFSGQRALDFVLFDKDLIDKTLLFNVKLIRVDKAADLRKASKKA